MPFNVLIAGAGPAGLEAALALRELAGDRVAMTLLAPEDELVYRPLSVTEPFAIVATRRYSLDAIARDVVAERVVDTLAAVDPGARTVRTDSGANLPYDALLIALGAKAEPALRARDDVLGPGRRRPRARARPGHRGRLLAARRVRGPAGDDVAAAALRAGAADGAARAYDVGPGPRAAPDHPGGHAAGRLRARGRAVDRRAARGGAHPGAHRRVRRGARRPDARPASGRDPLEVDRVVALPRLVGPPRAGTAGRRARASSPVDEHARVRGVRRRLGGRRHHATSRSSRAASPPSRPTPPPCDIAARAGADVEPRAVPARAARRAADRPRRVVAARAERRRRGRGRRSRAVVAAEQDRRAAGWRPTSPSATRRPADAPPRGTPLEVRLASGTAPADSEGAGRVVEVLSLEHPPPAGSKETS